MAAFLKTGVQGVSEGTHYTKATTGCAAIACPIVQECRRRKVNTHDVIIGSIFHQSQRAIEDYDKAIQLDPDDAWAYSGRGYAYRALGLHQRAIQDYDKAIQLQPSAKNYLNRGVDYSWLGDNQAAIDDYTKAIQLDRFYAVAYNNRSIAYGKLGQDKLADADKTVACSLDSQYC